MQEPIIRQASIKELEVIKLIGRETFYETFAHSNTASDMQKYLDENFNDEKVSREINNPDSLFFIAWEGNDAIGYLKVNLGKAQTEIQDNTSLEIERIYVRQIYHGKKVGQILYEKALEIAQLRKKSYIWLGVWEENPKAIRFYEKNGFTVFDKHIFKMGEDEQTDVMMKKVLP